MENPSLFFRDSVDVQSDSSYPGTCVPNLGDPVLHDGGDIPRCDNTFIADILTTSESPGPLLSPRDPLGLYEAPNMSLHDMTVDNIGSIHLDPTTCCDPALLADAGNLGKRNVTGRRPSTRRTRSSTTRSSSDSTQPSNSKSTSASSAPLALSEPSQRRRGRKAKVSVTSNQEEEKRSKFLEKNRLAASKCRQKKKEYVSELEGAKSQLEVQNSDLQLEYHGLLGEVSRMKTQLMFHANCQDPNIDRWIQNEARIFVENQGSQKFPNAIVDGNPYESRFNMAPTVAQPDWEESRRYASTSSNLDSFVYSNGSSLQASPTTSYCNQIPASKVKEEPEPLTY